MDGFRIYCHFCNIWGQEFRTEEGALKHWSTRPIEQSLETKLAEADRKLEVAEEALKGFAWSNSDYRWFNDKAKETLALIEGKEETNGNL